MSDELNMEAERAKCEACKGTGIDGYYDHGSAQFGSDAIEPMKCEACDGIGCTTPASAPMGTNGEAIPLPKLKRWTFDGGMTASLAAEGQWVLFEDIAPYAERIRHLERELEQAKAAFQGSENARQGELDAVNRILFGDQATVEAERRARKDAERARGTVQSIDTPEFRQLLTNLDFASKVVDAGDDRHLFDGALSALIAYIDGRTAGTAPEGWKWVPVEPTDVMVAHGRECGSAAIYRRMIAAAPTPLNGKEEAK